MSYAAATSAYRDMEVLSATPGRLVVIVYDFLLVNLRRTGIAMDTNNFELLATSIGKSQDAIAELICGLDMEKGGRIATDLGALYTFFLASLIDVGMKKDRELLARITAQVTEMRNAFEKITRLPTASAA
jgi:flagellar protein FliS